MKKLLLILTMLGTSLNQAMEESQTNIILPGQNGLGGEKAQQFGIIAGPLCSYYKTLENMQKIDMGQNNCIQDFNEQLTKDQKTTNKKFLYGVSQGTATLTNWIAEQPTEKQKQVAGLFLESVLGNGNNAILHTVENMVSHIASYLPFSRWWLPWAAKIVAFPSYNPFGKQAISSVEKLPKDLPVILMHANTDPQLPINDARQMYINLKKQGNPSYLFEIDAQYPAHIDILDEEKSKERKNKIQKNIQAIYKKHGLSYNPKILGKDFLGQDIDIEFQPSIQDVEQRISATDWAGKITRNIIDGSFAMAATYGLYSIIKSKL